jgi:general secretion pathway protein A
MRQVAQRIAVRYHLTGLSREDTGRYISYRLKTVGGQEDLFTTAAVDLIYKVSGGIPRSINLACQAALVYGFAEGAQTITQDIVHQIMKDNLGVSIEVSVQTPGADSASHAGDTQANASNNNGYKERLDSIEQIVKGLQGAVDNRLGVIEKVLGSQQNEAIQNLTKLLEQERERNQDLLRKHAQLEMMYLHLQQIIAKAKERAQKMRAGNS